MKYILKSHYYNDFTHSVSTGKAGCQSSEVFFGHAGETQKQVKDFVGKSRGIPEYLKLRLRWSLWFKNTLYFDLHNNAHSQLTCVLVMSTWIKPNETCQLIEVENAFAFKGDIVEMCSRKNYFMDTILGANFLHIPVSVVLGRCSNFLKLKKR